MKGTHIMLDLETFGVGPNAAIISIGACEMFREIERPRRTFHEKIELTSPGLGDIDASTVKWWLQQSDEARTALVADHERRTLQQAIQDFNQWCGYPEPENEPVSLWSNGPTFDEVILHNAFTRHSKKWPFRYNASRDFRTIVTVGEKIGIPWRSSKETKHDALQDAIDQAQHVEKVFAALGRQE